MKRIRGNRAQVSVEYMMTIALSLLAFGVIMYVANTLMGQSSLQIKIDATERAVNTIQEAVDYAYIQGHPTKYTTHIYIPGDIESGSIISGNSGNRTINLKVRVGSSFTDVYAVTDWDVVWRGGGPLNCSGIGSGRCEEGYYTVVIMTNESYPINIYKSIN